MPEREGPRPRGPRAEFSTMCCSLSRASPANPLVAFFRSGAASGLLRGLQPRVIPNFLGRLETALDRFFRRADRPCRRIEAQKADGGESKKNVNSLIGKMVYDV